MTDDAMIPPRKQAVRQRIVDALLSLLRDGEDINHDRVAERAGVGRRTVYRYFPDREMLMQSVWTGVTSLAGPDVAFPTTEADLLATMPGIYEGFDKIADYATLIRSTPQGRAVRLSQRDRRIESYTAAAADAVAALPPEDRILATAILQVLHTTPWLEMRDNWNLTGTQTARACGWAMRVLLQDLRERAGKALDEGPASESRQPGQK
ncbi:TetR/AcrR family transcriptional regulator [Sphingomonas montanisoli]|uniref:Helix-turn-helix transcriptional regulator n=1 Tax=Sphingomonas montanisoli TaxID=2606412 RepID=A0A5D9CDC8_9SPHN|nr:TetR/AcrR family transcriptional regulator [Sphingomonas montanisoli]TZG29253.1 helix-turn-helix transcriptional regulator [Sphingomonas montanisoli]